MRVTVGQCKQEKWVVFQGLHSICCWRLITSGSGVQLVPQRLSVQHPQFPGNHFQWQGSYRVCLVGDDLYPDTGSLTFSLFQITAI